MGSTSFTQTRSDEFHIAYSCNPLTGTDCGYRLLPGPQPEGVWTTPSPNALAVTGRTITQKAEDSASSTSARASASNVPTQRTPLDCRSSFITDPLTDQYNAIAQRWLAGICSKYSPDICTEYAKWMSCGGFGVRAWYNGGLPVWPDPVEAFCHMGLSSPLYFDAYQVRTERPSDMHYDTVTVRHGDYVTTVPLDDPSWQQRMGLPPLPEGCQIAGGMGCVIHFRAPCVPSGKPAEVLGWNVIVPGRIRPSD